MVAVKHAGLSADGGVGLKINGTTVVQGQEAAVADAANATASAAALTGVALDLVNLDDGSGSNELEDIGDTSSVNLGTLIERNFDKVGDEVEANRVNLASQKVELDKLIIDAESIRVALNLILARLEGHGLLAS